MSKKARKVYFEYIKMMQELVDKSQEDAEAAHSEADYLLCSFLTHLGYRGLVERFNKVKKFYA